MLKQADIAHYLLSHELVKPTVVVEEKLAVVDASRRNCVFLAAIAGGPTFVVKQNTRGDGRTLAHEAAVLRVLAETPELSGHAPTVVHHDPDAARLVLRTAGGARNWNEHQRAGRFPRTQARLLGRMLADLHRLPADNVAVLPPGVDAMWGLSLPEPPHQMLLDLSTGALDLVARLQANQALCGRLKELDGVGFDGVVVHGDLRWDNCLAVAPGDSHRRTRLLLVDWELAGHGAPDFDLGTVLAEYLRAWVESVPIVDTQEPGRFVAQAGHPLRRMRPAVHAFWSAYGFASARRPTLRHVIELAAVRLLQTAVEQAQALATPSAYQLTLVQLADNMLRRPEYAAWNLLGLGE
jgi:Ser/Thr protein kinase RdoA (MazF antagonist)